MFDRFLELLEPAVADWRVGDPTLEATEMGPLISAAHRDTVTPFVDDARVAFRGSAPDGAGLLVRAGGGARPTRRTTGSRSEEIFGPVVAVLPFDDEADAIRLANDTDLRPGRLDLDREPRPRHPRRRAASRAACCRSTRTRRCATATPFGGMKASGLGRELGPDAAEHFTETKNVFFATDAP